MTRPMLALIAVVLALAATACAAPTPWGGLARETGRVIEGGRP